MANKVIEKITEYYDKGSELKVQDLYNCIDDVLQDGEPRTFEGIQIEKHNRKKAILRYLENSAYAELYGYYGLKLKKIHPITERLKKLWEKVRIFK